jgi:hypothetical protein
MQEKYLRGVLGVDKETPGYIVRKEEQAESESGKESGKVWRQIGWNGRVQDTNGMLEKKGKEHGEEREREKPVCQWRSGKIQSKRKMDECRAEWKRQRHRQPRKNGENQRIQIQQGVWQRKFWSTWGERVQKKEKWWWDLDVGTKREKTGIGWEERKEGAECTMRRKKHIWNGNEREGEKATGRNTEWRWKGDRMDEKDMEEEGQNGKRNGWGLERKMLYFF